MNIPKWYENCSGRSMNTAILHIHSYIDDEMHAQCPATRCILASTEMFGRVEYVNPIPYYSKYRLYDGMHILYQFHTSIVPQCSVQYARKACGNDAKTPAEHSNQAAGRGATTEQKRERNIVHIKINKQPSRLTVKQRLEPTRY